MSIDVSLSGRVKVSFSVNFCIVAIKILKESAWNRRPILLNFKDI